MKIKDFVIALLLFVVVCVVAFGINALRKDPLPWIRQDAATRDAELEALENRGMLPGMHGDFQWVSFEELSRLVKSEAVKTGEVLVLDARPDAFFDMGHVPGAVNFPSSEVEVVYPKMKAAIANAKRVIVYCQDRQCESSKIVAEALKAKGHGKNVEVFRGGWMEWERKGRNAEIRHKGTQENTKENKENAEVRHKRTQENTKENKGKLKSGNLGQVGILLFHGGPTEKRHESMEGALWASDSAATFDSLHFNLRSFFFLKKFYAVHYAFFNVAQTSRPWDAWPGRPCHVGAAHS